MKKRILPVISLFILYACAATAATPSIPNHSIVVSEIRGPALSVHFIDVGQGDGILIQSPDGHAIMVDTGARGKKRRTETYLRNVGITKLDAILISHSHLDHIGGAIHLLKSFPVLEMWTSGYFHPTKFAQKLLKTVEEKKVKLKTLRRGEIVMLGKDVKIQAVHPGKEDKPVDHDLNNFSLSIRVTYKDIDFLLVGDAETKAERAMMRSGLMLESEFLKLGHHGSRTATSLTFLDAVKPLFGVISCGEKNKFSHPHKETLELLKTKKIPVLRTDEVGTIVVRTDGKKISINVKGRTPVSIVEPGTGIIFIKTGRISHEDRLSHLRQPALLRRDRSLRRAA